MGTYGTCPAHYGNIQVSRGVGHTVPLLMHVPLSAYYTLSPPPLEGPGYEASIPLCTIIVPEHNA